MRANEGGGGEHNELMAKLRGEVRASARTKYDAGKQKYGDSWLDSEPYYHLDRMEEEFYEFRQAVLHDRDPEAAIEELADVVNYGLMFAILTGLYDTATEREDTA